MGRKPYRKETCQPSQNRKGWNVQEICKNLGNVRLLVSDDTVVSVMEQVVNASWRSTDMGLAGARPYNNAGARAYFNMLTAGANDPAVIRFAPAVITFCLRDIKNVIRYFACQGKKMNNKQGLCIIIVWAIMPSYF